MDLDRILADHALWCADPTQGKRANLRGADLRRANLRGADLRCTDLRGANLHAASLSGADLRCTDLRRANLCAADLYDADLCDAMLPDAPIVAGLRKRIQAIVAEQPDRLDMSQWHCGTAHCLAGWAIELAVEAGKQLERDTSSLTAGRLIWLASEGVEPDYFGSDEEARKWLEGE